MPDMRQAIAYAETHGWTVSRRSSGHLAFGKNGCTVFSSSTPGDRRSEKNAVAKLKRVDRVAGAKGLR